MFFAFLSIFVRFGDSEDVLGVLEGTRRALGVSGAPRVGFGTFWGDLGGSQGGVQSSLLGGEYVTNTGVLELGRFSVTCRGVWILFVFSMFC